jgi:hypothetical protein
MRRREFIAGLGAAAIANQGARAQEQARMRRVVALMVGSPNEPRDLALIATLQRTLEGLGWAAGRNLSIDVLWVSGDASRMTENASGPPPPTR